METNSLQQELVPDAPVVLRLVGTSTTSVALRFVVSVMRGGSAVDQWELAIAPLPQHRKKKKTTKKKQMGAVEVEVEREEQLVWVIHPGAPSVEGADELVHTGNGTSLVAERVLGQLLSDVTYAVTLRCRNRSGWGKWSAEATARTPSGCTIPGAPSIMALEVLPLVAKPTPGEPPGTSTTQATLRVRWVAPSTDGGSPVIKYVVRCWLRAKGKRQLVSEQEGATQEAAAHGHTAFKHVVLDGRTCVQAAFVVALGQAYEVECRAANAVGGGAFSAPRPVNIAPPTTWQCAVCAKQNLEVVKQCAVCSTARGYEGAGRLLMLGVANSTLAMMCVALRKDAPRAPILTFDCVEHNSRTRQDLQFTDTDAAAIADALVANTRVTHLALTNNARNITAVGFGALVAVLDEDCGYSALTALDFGNNGLRGRAIKALAKALRENNSVTYLRLDDNPIGDKGVTVLARALVKTSSLTSLSLSNCALTARGASALATALDMTSLLYALDVSFNFAGGGDAAAHELGAMRCSTLQRLDMVGCDIGDPGLASLASRLATQGLGIARVTLGECPRMSEAGINALARANVRGSTLHLDCWYSCTTCLPCEALKRDIGAMVSVLPVLQTLREIVLSDARIGDFAAIALCTELSIAAHSVRHLYLCGNRITDIACAAIAAVHVEAVDLSRNRITDRGVQLLAAALRHEHHPCMSLVLSRNRLRSAGGMFCLEALRASNAYWLDVRMNRGVEDETLSRIDANLKLRAPFRQCQLDGRLGAQGLELGVHGLAEALLSLPHSCHLRIMDLRWNGLGDEGVASCLAAFLRTDRELDSLYLDHNGIGDRGVASLAGALIAGSKLRNLYLSNNSRIGDRGAAALALALPRSNLWVLVMHSCSVSDKGARQFEMCIPRCAIKHLNLTHQDVPERMLESISMKLKDRAEQQVQQQRRRRQQPRQMQPGVAVSPIKLPRIQHFIPDAVREGAQSRGGFNITSTRGSAVVDRQLRRAERRKQQAIGVHKSKSGGRRTRKQKVAKHQL